MSNMITINTVYWVNLLRKAAHAEECRTALQVAYDAVYSHSRFIIHDICTLPIV